MKFSRLLVIVFLMNFTVTSSLAINLNDSDKTDSEKIIPVKITTTEIPEEKIKSIRAVDGEQPVHPVNINIGLSKLTLFGYAQTGYTYTDIGGQKSNAFDITRIVLMANAELTSKLNFFIMYDAVKANCMSIMPNTIFFCLKTSNRSI